MTVRQLVLILILAILVGLIAEYVLRLIGIANIGGTVGGAVGIIAAMILNKSKGSNKKDTK